MSDETFSPFSKARIEALSDGVFAIAMTLLFVLAQAAITIVATRRADLVRRRHVRVEAV